MLLDVLDGVLAGLLEIPGGIPTTLVFFLVLLKMKEEPARFGDPEGPEVA